ncbi:MAG: hypothetical protein LBD95_04425, partial [Clostridiales Family XIII bacterium]|nr:hypothetical protein [Clostridiales Family XIII bacterium]
MHHGTHPLRKAKRRTLVAVLVLALLLPILPSVPRVAADGVEAPRIVRQPSDGTYSEQATARFYVRASSPDDGYLTYAWYISGPYNAPIPADRTGDLTGVKIEGAESSVLTTLTPAVTGTLYYYYWVEIQNHSGGETSTSLRSRAALAKIVDKALQPQLMNGDFETDAATSFPGTKLNKGIHNSNTTAA